eukprot:jgi/Picsp_1/3287/NSC_06127-R1_protein
MGLCVLRCTTPGAGGLKAIKPWLTTTRLSARRPSLAVSAERKGIQDDRKITNKIQRNNAMKDGKGHLDASLGTLALWGYLCSPASALTEQPTGSPPASSYYVSLGLFLVTLPGLWSLIKRSPKAKVRRKTFEVAGPAVEGHVPLDSRARQIFNYFKTYNYAVKSTGEVIVFEGNYKASVGQAAALVLYTLVSLASTALVLSIAAPFGGNWWYALCLISPAAGAYYLRNAERTEEFKVKMATSDDDKVTDIVVEGDEEEIDRFRRELDLYEKGMEYVKGILE